MHVVTLEFRQLVGFTEHGKGIALVLLGTLAIAGPGNGQSQFAELQRVNLSPSSAPANAVGAADVNADGHIDLLIGNSPPSSSSPLGQDDLYLNVGDATFAKITKSHLPAARNTTLAVHLKDIDKDGDIDLAIGCSRGTLIYINDGTGRFSDGTVLRLPGAPPSTSLALADLDGDGDEDLVLGVQGQNRLYLNDGRGFFVDTTISSMPTASEVTQGVSVGDVDADQDLDIFFAGSPNKLYLNDGSARFVDASATHLPPGSSYSRCANFGDVDNDSDLDLALANNSLGLGRQNSLYVNDGTGRFRDVTPTSLPQAVDHTLSVALTDLDSDGDPDLVFANALGQNTLYINNGLGIFRDATQQLPPDSDTTTGVVVADLNSDGHADIVFVNSGEPHQVHINDGTGRFLFKPSLTIPAQRDPTTAVASADVDSDGHLDLLIGNWKEPNRLLRNNGTGGFVDETLLRLPLDAGNTLAVIFLDIDGDGEPDIVTGNSGEQNRVYINNGGFFTNETQARLLPATTNTYAVAALDADGDGDTDIVFGNWGQQNA